MDPLLSTTEHYGLTKEQLDILGRTSGQNAVALREMKSPIVLFLDEFKNPLIIILLVAAGLSFITASYVEGVLVVGIVLVSSILNFVSSYRSNKAVSLLLKKVQLMVAVYREGKLISIAAADLVVGDTIVLEAGNVVPADGVVREAKDFFVNESSLTGESIPLEKGPGSEVFLGTGVVTGRAYVDITHIGQATKYYAIVRELDKAPAPSEFETGIRAFSILITKIAIGMGVLVFAANALMKGDFLQALLFATALAVGITPELLPMIITLNMSRASVRMARRGIIVKKLESMQNFGSMDVLCTDKTGTLTLDKISVIKYITGDGADSDHVLELAYVTSSLHTGHRGSLDEAIAETKKFDMSGYQKLDEIPFDFERRRDSIVVQKNTERVLVTKGAPENILTVCALSAQDRLRAEHVFESLSGDGYRVLAVATRILENIQEVYEASEEHDMHLEGFIAFIDPPKQDVKGVLEDLVHRGIAIKIITGDHVLVARKVAQEVGFTMIESLDGPNIEKMSDEELSSVLDATTIFARVVPAQKNRIITLLRKAGHVVGYMGDGINDAPALRTADIGISVSNACDVAKESADIVLSNKSLHILIDGVLEGRRTFANTIKYITMAVSSNFGNMFSMTGASFLLPFLPMLPTQVLLNNILYESSQLALPFDTVEEDVVNKPRPWDMRFIKRFMIVFGLASSLFDFLTFFVLFKVFHLADASFQTGWFIQSFATQALVIFIIRSPKLFFRARASHVLVRICAVGSVIIAWIIALSGLGHIFGFVPLPLPIIGAIVCIICVYLASIETIKHFFYKRFTI